MKLIIGAIWVCLLVIAGYVIIMWWFVQMLLSAVRAVVYGL